MEKRETWSSKVGFILAAAGSAIGLGNIWRFPYLAGMNGGSAFILIYVAVAILIGTSVMIAEFTLGRLTKKGAVGAFKSINKRWTFTGFIGVLAAFSVMGFYPVVGGWTLAYMFKSLTGILSKPEELESVFSKFISNPLEPLIWFLIYLILNAIIVQKGISKGIEKASEILMPTLFGIIILLAVKSLTLQNSIEGLKFIFKADFSKVTPQTILTALGQAFFSLSIGMGCMITYGSYLKKEEKIPNNALLVTLMDTLAAILAGIAIFPAVFAFGVEPTAGPGLVFIVVPQVFSKMGIFGILASFIFFTALAVAALTSSISLLETAAAYFIDELNWERKKAVRLSTTIMFTLGIFSSLSLGVLSNFKILGLNIFDFFDTLSTNVFLTIGGLLTAIFVGWIVKKEQLKRELSNEGTVNFPLFNTWHILMKFVIPLAVGIIALSGFLKSQGQIGVMILGLIIVIFLALFSEKL